MLTTRCPHCQTRFRVSPEQLQLRQGSVRCGSCREVFIGSDFLNPPQAGAGAAAAEAQTGTPAPHNESTMQDELDALSKAISDLQNKPWREPAGMTPESTQEPASDWDEDDEDAPEPAFIQQARKKQRAQRIRKWLLALGIPLLLLALLAQLTYRFRDDLAVRVPESGPLLRAACARLGCKIALPAQINALSLQSSQLLAVPEQAEHFELVALLRNQSNTPQAWPALELLLKDETGQPLVRKVFLAAEFLPASVDKSLGIASHSEREVRVAFMLTGAQPAGFQLTMFYP